MTGPTSGVSSPTAQTRKEVGISVCPETLSFRGWAPTISRPQYFKILSVGTNKNHIVFSFTLKWRKTSVTHFARLSDYSQLPRNIWKGVAFHDQKCPRFHWFRWRTFWAIIVVSVLINVYKSSVIKLATCTVIALYHISINNQLDATITVYQ